MNTIGIFAGRGDTILAMGLALLLGIYLGYKLRSWILWMEFKLNRKDREK